MGTNPTRITTGVVRFCYANVFKPVAMNEGDEPKYSACIIIRKDDKATLDKIEAATKAAIELGKSRLADKSGRVPANIKTPLRDGDLERADDPAFADSYFLNASTMRQPAVVDLSLQPIIDPNAFYSGCYGRVSLNFFAFAVNGNKGIAVGLNNLQKVRDGEPLAGASSAEDDFGGENSYDDLA